MKSNRWVILAVLVLARTAMGYQFQSIGSLSPLLVDEFGIDFAALGALIGLFMLPGIIISVPGGVLGNWLGDKRVALFGLALMVAGGLITAVGGNVDAVTVGRIFSGAGAVLLNVVMTKMVADWFGEKQLITAMSLLVTSWPLGIGLGLVSQGAIAAEFAWPAAMFVTSALSALAFALVWLTYATPDGARATGRPARLLGGLSLREAVLVSVIGVIWMLFNVGFILVVSFTPTFLTESGSSVASAGLVTSLALWITVVALPFGGLLVDRAGRDTLIILLSLLTMAAAMIALPSVSILAMVVVVGIAAGPPAGAIMALATKVLRPENRNTGMGVYFTWYYAGMTALPFVAGFVRDVSEDPEGPFIFGGVLLGLCALVLVIFDLTRRRMAAAPPPAGWT